MHDGALAHFSLCAPRHLNARYRGHWIGRGGPIVWPPRSPDQNPLDFFLSGYLKSLVYSTAVNDAASPPGILERVRSSMRRRAEACIQAEAGNVEHFINVI
jgi:hypothetical protein